MVSFKGAVNGVVNIQRINEVFGLDNAFKDWGKYEFLVELSDLREKLNRRQLKKHLEARNEITTGTKRQLCERLSTSVQNETEQRIRKSQEAEAQHQRIAKLEQSGSIYVAGRNDFGQLGLTSEEALFILKDDFTAVPSLRGVQPNSISCGGNAVYCATKESLVYAWGANNKKYGSFDTPHIIEHLIGEEIIHISAGSSHVCANSHGGDCFEWGRLGTNHVSKEPTLVDALPEHEEVKYISSGDKHNCILTEEGKVYSWGYASDGRLGIGKDSAYESKYSTEAFIKNPSLVNFPFRESIHCISCGTLHVLAISSSFEVYSWGSGSGGKLGQGDFEDRWKPTKIASLSSMHCLDISAGTWHSACIIVVPPFRGAGWLMTWGTGCYGQLALGKNTAAPKPTLVDGFRRKRIIVKRIFCGSHHCAAITSDNSLYTWGSNSYGCLGRQVLTNKIVTEYTSEPGWCPNFGKKINHIGRGLPLIVCCGRGFTIVGTEPFHHDLKDNS